MPFQSHQVVSNDARRRADQKLLQETFSPQGQKMEQINLSKVTSYSQAKTEFPADKFEVE